MFIIEHENSPSKHAIFYWMSIILENSKERLIWFVHICLVLLYFENNCTIITTGWTYIEAARRVRVDMWSVQVCSLNSFIITSPVARAYTLSQLGFRMFMLLRPCSSRYILLLQLQSRVVTYLINLALNQSLSLYIQCVWLLIQPII